ncbi:hypothetical protein [Paucibacter sp. KCTC 42545]|uniref:hypothetical protein n=1 Tax=Paucibacter sp. KCTC 42545 TaxID=1768242 RepID=UPI000733A58A|nr:hypothetical protein [Paucibacter sp. KCTC 42545]ALT78799.1 hypothetical protein AT984_18005 [Paucibacter sp. KCTC 42545]
MSKSIKHLLLALAILLALYAGASVLATLSQLANAADRIYSGAGQYLFWALTALFAGLAATPCLLYLRLPKPLIPPADRSEPAFSIYQADLLVALRRNPLLAGSPLNTPDDLPAALSLLNAKADEEALQAASATFVSTALMQNGRLDGLLVLLNQLRLVYRLMAVYHVRPSPRQALYVYGNVGAAILIASSIEDIDFSELATPMISAAAPGLAANLPGLGGISRLLTNSLANGAANAFLTLRVAMLTKQYCAALVQPELEATRRSASVAALALLGVVTRDCGVRVAKSVFKATGAVFTDAASATGQGVKDATQSVLGATAQMGSKVGRALVSSADSAKLLGLKAVRLGRKAEPGVQVALELGDEGKDS